MVSRKNKTCMQNRNSNPISEHVALRDWYRSLNVPPRLP
jgi:hypothetical protein